MTREGGDERNGAFLYEVLEGRITERPSAGGFFGYARDGADFAHCLQCIPRSDGRVFWSVWVQGVGWRLPPNDVRRAACTRGIWRVTYVASEAMAKQRMLFAINKRLRTAQNRRVILPIDGLS
jgi:hypothetical protein